MKRSEIGLNQFFFRNIILCLLICIGCTQTAWSWGLTGHRLIARIADTRISDSTRSKISAILQGKSMADIAIWADLEKKIRTETAPWHYVDFDKGKDGKEFVPNMKDPNIITALASFTQDLQQNNLSEKDRREALMYIIHLVGDIHQPLHCAVTGDAGGNAILVYFFGKKTNLHKVWDTWMVEELPGTESEKLAYLEKNWGNILKKASEKPDFYEWAVESNKISRWHSYIIPKNHRLGKKYVKNNIQSCSQQLWLAGIRLAKLLDSIFADQASGFHQPDK